MRNVELPGYSPGTVIYFSAAATQVVPDMHRVSPCLSIYGGNEFFDKCGADRIFQSSNEHHDGYCQVGDRLPVGPAVCYFDNIDFQLLQIDIVEPVSRYAFRSPVPCW